MSALKQSAAFEKLAYATIWTAVVTLVVLFASALFLLNKTADVERAGGFTMLKFRVCARKLERFVQRRRSRAQQTPSGRTFCVCANAFDRADKQRLDAPRSTRNAKVRDFELHVGAL